MRAPRFQWSHLIGLTVSEAVIQDQRRRWAGKVIEVPDTFPAREHAAVVDALVALTRWPILANGSAQPHGAIQLVQGDRAPSPAPDGVRVWARPIHDDARETRLTPELRQLGQALFELLGRNFRTGPLARMAGLGPAAVDTPATAADFVSGAWAAIDEAGAAQLDDQMILTAGLAEVLVGLLAGVGADVAQWTLGMAVDPSLPWLLLEGTAASIPRDVAVEATFRAGLALWRPERSAQSPVVLRRSLHMITELPEVEGRARWADLTTALEARLPAEVLAPLRLSASPRAPLNLPGPGRAPELIGRDGELSRLTELLAPADHIQTVILCGPHGSGRRALAAATAERLSPGREAIWVSLGADPIQGYLRLGEALEVRWPEGADRQDRVQATAWVQRVFDALRAYACLLIVSDVEPIPEDELAAWLPSGAGRVATLLLSEREERPVQRDRDAVLVSVSPLSDTDARALLAARAPALRAPALDGLLSRLGNQAGLIVLAGDALATRTVSELERALDEDEGPPIRTLAALIVQSLPEAARRAALALRVGPASGSWVEVTRAVAGLEDDRPILALVEARMATREADQVRPAALLRLAPDAVFGAAAIEEAARVHAVVATQAWSVAATRGDGTLMLRLEPDLWVGGPRLATLTRGGPLASRRLAAQVSRLLLAHKASSAAHAALAYTLADAAASGAMEDLSPQDRIGLEEGRLNALMCLVELGRHEHADLLITTIHRLLPDAQRTENLPWESKLTSTLAMATLRQPDRARPSLLKEAKQLLEHSVAMARRADHPAASLSALARLAGVELNLAEGAEDGLRASIQHSLEALEIARAQGELYAVAGVYSILGNAWSAMRLHGDTLWRALEASAIGASLHSREQDLRAWASARHNMAEVLRRMQVQPPGRALQMAWEIELELYSLAAGDLGWEVWAACRIGLAAIALAMPTEERLGRVEVAVQVCREVVDQLPVGEQELKRGTAQLHMGMAYRQLGFAGETPALEQAEKALRGALATFQACGAHLFCGDTCAYLAQVLAMQASSPRAPRLREALNLCEQAQRYLPDRAANHLEALNLAGILQHELSVKDVQAGADSLERLFRGLQHPPQPEAVNSWINILNNIFKLLPLIPAPDQASWTTRLREHLAAMQAALPAEPPPSIRATLEQAMTSLAEVPAAFTKP